MKATLHALMLSIGLFFLLPVSARAYYSPEQGRWINRDPIEEPAFFDTHMKPRQVIGEWIDYAITAANAYEFVGNSSVNLTDLDGCRMTPNGEVSLDTSNRRKPPGGMKLIRVPKCTVLFIYGHNYVGNFQKDGLQWIWNIVSERDKQKDCAYAAVAGCAANLVPNEIPLPGFKYSDYDVADQGVIKVTTLLDMWRDVRQKHYPKAIQDLKDCSCKCKTVTLMWTKIGGGLPDLKPDIGQVRLP
jgi:hypothetical protein